MDTRLTRNTRSDNDQRDGEGNLSIALLLWKQSQADRLGLAAGGTHPLAVASKSDCNPVAGFVARIQHHALLFSVRRQASQPTGWKRRGMAYISSVISGCLICRESKVRTPRW